MRAFAVLFSGGLCHRPREPPLDGLGYSGDGAGCSKGAGGTEGMWVGGAEGAQVCVSSSGLGIEETSVP